MPICQCLFDSIYIVNTKKTLLLSRCPGDHLDQMLDILIWKSTLASMHVRHVTLEWKMSAGNIKPTVDFLSSWLWTKWWTNDCHFIFMLCVYFSRLFVFFLFRVETLISQNQYGLVNYWAGQNSQIINNAFSKREHCCCYHFRFN